MSGPIVRKYGFPNFEKIFGEKGLQHGAEDPSATAPTQTPPAPAQAETEAGKPPKTDKKS